MRFLIVDDQSKQSEGIAENLRGMPGTKILTATNTKMIDEIIDFEIPVDAALVDLRLKKSANGGKINTDGYRVCEKLKNHFPEILIVGYSSSLNADSEENAEIIKKFQQMGADIVYSAAELTVDAVSALFKQFQEKMMEKNNSVNTLPKIFIASSGRSLGVADAIQNRLIGTYPNVEIWNQTKEFELGELTIQALENVVDNFDYGVFVFEADDLIVDSETKESKHWITRDNVIFEAGMFLGRKGRKRLCVVTPSRSDLHMLTDFNGVTTARYSMEPENLVAALNPACTKILEALSGVTQELNSRGIFEGTST